MNHRDTRCTNIIWWLTCTPEVVNDQNYMVNEPYIICTICIKIVFILYLDALEVDHVTRQISWFFLNPEDWLCFSLYEFFFMLGTCYSMTPRRASSVIRTKKARLLVKRLEERYSCITKMLLDIHGWITKEYLQFFLVDHTRILKITSVLFFRLTINLLHEAVLLVTSCSC
mgnify:CR=1 FL=1